MTKATNNDSNWYANVFKAWNSKVLGPKPSTEMLASVHNLDARPGKQALACAMALRDCGVTGSQIVVATGAPQLNKMRGYISDGIFKRLAVPPSAEGHTVYKLELTGKAKQRITQKLARIAKAEANEAAKAEKPAKAPAKAKGAAKAKAPAKGAAKPATGDVAPQAPAPVTPTDTGDAQQPQA